MSPLDVGIVEVLMAAATCPKQFVAACVVRSAGMSRGGRLPDNVPGRWTSCGVVAGGTRLSAVLV